MTVTPNSPVDKGDHQTFTLIEQCQDAIGRRVMARPIKGESISGILIAVDRDAVTIAADDGETTLFRWALAFIKVAPEASR